MGRTTIFAQNLVSVTRLTDVDNGFVLHWRNGRNHYYVTKDTDVDAVLSALFETLEAVLGGECEMVEANSLAVSNALEASFARRPRSNYTV